ncbi:aminopeptidase P family protein [Advenella sp. RU8]|uniref:aminopeptidase P family protein n=1 Tax=Advenella sp. RU8 TaxID=3399575 RepID=UPI003AAABEAD
MNPCKQRVARLREQMKNRGLDAYIVPSADPHLSEYLPEHWQARTWLSGFDGSAGTLLVTANFAGLWTDSRYWEQAQAQLKGSDIALMQQGQDGVPDMDDWLCTELQPGMKVGADGFTLSMRLAQDLQSALEGVSVRFSCNETLLDNIWPDRPALPLEAIYEHEAPFVSQSRAEKLQQIRKGMEKLGAQWHLLSSLDDIAWTLNLRGSDVSYNPVFLSYLLIGPEQSELFVDAAKLSPELIEKLATDRISIKPYENIGNALAALKDNEKLLIDPARTTIGICQAAASLKRVEALNPSQLLKSRKTAADIQNVRNAMEADGAALCEFFAWFEQAMANGEAVTEVTIDERINAARARQPHFVCPSFATIAGFNANGAMPHYRATPESHAVIEGNGLLLIDSGGQYLNGTTDITRVVPVGQVSESQKADYTLVLKAMIALSRAVFPVGFPAPLLDPIARMPLWQQGLDFGHGTGHGVGYFLNVHEGPQGISHRGYRNLNTGMQEGMITSNEPGLYRPGQWGIRIENLVCNVSGGETEFGRFLKFETLTLCPIDTRCIATHMLDEAERNWLNQYHEQVRNRLQPLVDGAALQWLLERTRPL